MNTASVRLIVEISFLSYRCNPRKSNFALSWCRLIRHRSQHHVALTSSSGAATTLGHSEKANGDPLTILSPYLATEPDEVVLRDPAQNRSLNIYFTKITRKFKQNSKRLSKVEICKRSTKPKRKIIRRLHLWGVSKTNSQLETIIRDLLIVHLSLLPPHKFISELDFRPRKLAPAPPYLATEEIRVKVRPRSIPWGSAGLSFEWWEKENL